MKKDLKKYTIKDIASIAGVSPRTVSRVLNEEENVHPKTRNRVLEIIKNTGYEVNIIARSLRKKQTGIIIVFVGESTINYVGNFHNSVIRYIDVEANRLGYKVIISRSSAYKIEKDRHDGFYLLKNRLADGAVLFDTRDKDPRIEYLVTENIPFVIIGKDPIYKNTSYVNLDNVKAGYIGAKYLIKKGYDSIVFFLGNKDFTVNHDRAEGFLSACIESNIGRFSIEYGVINAKIAYKRTKELLKQAKFPRAIFISGDERATGVYHAIYEKSLKIPEDMAVLSIDNIPISEYFFPPLTTIDQSVDKMAFHAIKILDNALKNPDHREFKRIILPPKLIIRGSA